MAADPTRGVDPTRNPAFWCEEHDRPECVHDRKQSRGGGRCHGLAIAGTDSCRMHAGTTGEVAKAKGEAVTAWSAVGGTPTISATDAVLGMLQMSWLRVHLYARLLEAQVAEGPDAAGLVGETTGASPAIGTYATGEAVRGLALLEAQERDRCVRFAKTAHDMGIAEAQVQLAEQQGLLLAGVVHRILDRLELTREQRALVATVVPDELRAVVGVSS